MTHEEPEYTVQDDPETVSINNFIKAWITGKRTKEQMELLTKNEWLSTFADNFYNHYAVI